MTVVVEGGEKLAALSRILGDTGEKKLRRELERGVREPVKSLIPIIEAHAVATLPKRGGFATYFAGSLRLRVVRSNKGAYPGIRLVGQYPGRIRRIDAGALRHPVFADPDKDRTAWAWVTQTIEPGFFSKPCEENGPTILEAVEKVMQQVADQVSIELGG